MQDHIQRVIAAIAPHDSIERFERLGVQVIQGAGEFIDRHTLRVNDTHIKATYFVLATGSHPVAPPIPGLEAVDYLTNETIFNLKVKPTRLLVIGGGPIGCELAQAHRLLGIPVALFDMATILPKDDAACVDVVRQKMLQQGLELHENMNILRVAKTANGVEIHVEEHGKAKTITGSHVLVATGRKANVHGLALEKAGVQFDEHGVQVDARLRSTNKRIYALGDVAGSVQLHRARLDLTLS